jgi:hypothetical protein
LQIVVFEHLGILLLILCNEIHHFAHDLLDPLSLAKLQDKCLNHWCLQQRDEVGKNIVQTQAILAILTHQINQVLQNMEDSKFDGNHVRVLLDAVVAVTLKCTYYYPF